MNERKKQILNAAVQCFAQKGYHATSIKDIVEEIGISKGSVYIYFKSKDDILFSALHYTCDQIEQKQLCIVRDQSLSPKERLLALLSSHVEFAVEHKDFILMLMSEQAIKLNEQMKAFLEERRALSLQIYYQLINEMVDNTARPYVLDAVMVIQAMIHHYTMFLLLEHIDIEKEKLVGFFVTHLEDSIQSMVDRQREPLITPAIFKNFGAPVPHSQHSGLGNSFGPIEKIRSQLAKLSLEPEAEQQMASYLLVLERELAKDQPQAAVISSLMEDLQQFDHRRLDLQLQELENEIKKFVPKLS